MTPFASDQWVMLVLTFLLGLVIGMYLLSGRKWKQRYNEELARREALERELREMDVVRSAAARHPVDVDNRAGRI